MQDNNGKLVTVSYKGRLDDGWQFAEATPDAPMTFPCLPGFMLPEFIDTVRDMEVGETRAVRVSPDKAFQEWTEERLITVERSKLPNADGLSVGDIVHLQDAEGTDYPARLVSLDENQAVFDANHEAVAQGLNFEITLHAVKDTPFQLGNI